MPVEIKELIIRASAGEGKEQSSLACETPASGASPQNPIDDAVVEACVQQVLNILRRSRER